MAELGETVCFVLINSLDLKIIPPSLIKWGIKISEGDIDIRAWDTPRLDAEVMAVDDHATDLKLKKS